MRWRRRRRLVFPAGLVRDRCVEAVGAVGGRSAVLPQGIEAARRCWAHGSVW